MFTAGETPEEDDGKFLAVLIDCEDAKLLKAAPDLLAALEALDKHYRDKITVHDTMLREDHPLRLSAAARAKARGG